MYPDISWFLEFLSRMNTIDCKKKGAEISEGFCFHVFVLQIPQSVQWMKAKQNARNRHVSARLDG